MGNIVKYLGSSVVPNEPNTFRMYLEYVSGGSLKDIIKLKGKLPTDLSRFYLRQILSGLAFLHSNSVIHRDLKPGNILISVESTLKLADCGAAFDLSSMTQTQEQTLCGTPAYTAPEVIKKEKHTTASDIWSVGVVAFNMITGKLPWVSKDIYSLLFAIANLKIELVFPQGTDRATITFIHACLKPWAESRPSAKKLMEFPFLKDSVAVAEIPGNATVAEQDSEFLDSWATLATMTLPEDKTIPVRRAELKR